MSQIPTQELWPQQNQNRSMPINSRMRRYIRKLASSRRSMLRSRRGRSASAAVASVPRRVPRGLVPKTYTFQRTIQQTLPMNQSTGWGGTGSFALTLAASLATLDVFAGGTLLYQPVMPGLTDFTNLFDMYKITNIRYEIYYSVNDNTLPSSNALPLVHIANDYNDTSGFTLADIQQYPNMYTFQLGKEKPIVWDCQPRVRLDVLTNTGITSSSAFNTTGWIDTSSPSIQQLGTKVWLNTMGRTANVDIGNAVLIATFNIEFKNPR